MPETLQVHLNDAKALTTTNLQTLATQQLEGAVERSATDDLLTGYHFTDGCQRIIVVEGLSRGAMKLLFEVCPRHLFSLYGSPCLLEEWRDFQSSRDDRPWPPSLLILQTMMMMK